MILAEDYVIITDVAGLGADHPLFVAALRVIVQQVKDSGKAEEAEALRLHWTLEKDLTA